MDLTASGKDLGNYMEIYPPEILMTEYGEFLCLFYIFLTLKA